MTKTLYSLKGSESIVIDVDESGDFIEVHLDADIAAKLGRVLVTPMSAPASVSLVAVDTSNAQTLLTLGDGLSVIGGVLSASGGGGGGVTLKAGHVAGFFPVKIYLADGTISPLTSLGDGVSNIKAISFSTISSNTVSSMPEGILIRSDGTIIGIGTINVPQADATYYFIPFVSGTCAAGTND